MAPPGPVKIGHKKMAAEGGRIDFMFLGPPSPGRWIRYCAMVKLANFCQTLAKPLYCTSARYLNRENQILNRMLIAIRH